ncbi:MAG: pathogenicity island protein [Pseudomonadota bacterium]
MDTDSTETRSLATDLREKGGLAAHLDVDPKDLRLGLEVAKAHRDRGDVAGAMRIYAALSLCDMNEPDYQQGIADCAYAMGEFGLALNAASALIALAPKRAVGYYLSGAACLAMGHEAEAKEDLTEAKKLALESRDTMVHAEADKLLRSMGVVAGNA